MSIHTPYISEIAFHTYAINEFGMDAMYLLIGSERALLIDTGTGTCDLKGIVEKLTDKPYDVVLTHGHVDHAGGIDQFEKVYMHSADMERAQQLTRQERLDYAMIMHRNDVNNVYAFDPEQVREWKKIPQFVPVTEGHVFELGERQIEVFHVPGHTAGSISLLDRKYRLHFSGDACNTNTLVLGGSITGLYHSAEKIKALESAFDRDFNGHVGYAGDPTCFSLPEKTRDDVMEICRRILKGNAEITTQPFLGSVSHGVSYGCARVVYTQETVLIRDGETPVL